MRTFIFACLAIASAALALPAPAAAELDPVRPDFALISVSGKSGLLSSADAASAIGTNLTRVSPAQSALGDRPADGLLDFTNVENGCTARQDAIGDASVEEVT